MGFEDMTPIQEHSFPHILAGKDIIAGAETGSGKTAACAIPLIQSVDPTLNAVQGLILVPTRELALQYVQVISDIAKCTDVIPFAVYGGFSMSIQLGKLDHGVHILVATPGRLIDLIYNSPLSLSEVKTFVLDEADEMLNMGFLTDVEFVISCLIHEHQTLLFSATMPKEIVRLASKHMKDPVNIELNVDQIAPQNLEHCFQQISPGNRFDTLVKYIQDESPTQAIIFCNSRNHCETMYKDLRKVFKSVEIIHGGLEQSRRTSLFNRFRKKDIQLMVATDIAARGLDFSHVSHVINVEMPRGTDAYTHRTGRTARMGREGKAITFFTARQLRDLKNLIRKKNLTPNFIGTVPDMENVSSSRGHRKHPQHAGRHGKPRRHRPRD